VSRWRPYRKGISWQPRCSTCGEPLKALRWGHEERCEAFTRARRHRVARIGLFLVVLAVGVLVLPFFSQL
jgi:predicted nucleic acid-binding Zn ribbon protein